MRDTRGDRRARVASGGWRTRPGRHADDRAIAALAVPALGALAADPLYSLVDTAFVGRLGTPELAALGVGAAAFTASFWLFSFLAYGVTPRVAAALGGERPEEAARIGVQALGLALVLGAAVTLVGVVFTGPIVRAFGADGEVTRLAETYLRIRVLAAVPVLIAQVGQGYLRGAHDTRTPTYIVCAGAAANVVVGYVLIFPAGLGIAGAAWAVVVCQSAVAAVFVVTLARRMTAPSWRPDASVMRSLLTVGADLAVRTGSLLAGLTVVVAVAARIGTHAVAAWQIAMQVFLLLSLTLDSVAIAAQALVGRDLGAGRGERAYEVSARLLTLGTYVGCALGAGLLLLALPIARAFTEDPVVASDAGALLLWLALLQPVGAIAFTFDGILIGASDTRFLARSMAGSSVLLVALALLTLRAGWGLAGLAAGMTLWMAARALWTGARWRSRAWLAPAVASSR